MRRVSQQDRILPQNVGTSNEPKKKKKSTMDYYMVRVYCIHLFVRDWNQDWGPKWTGGEDQNNPRTTTMFSKESPK